MLCYNPVLAIALSCEFLDKIANTKNIFRHECKLVKEQLMRLGAFLVDNIEDDKIARVFLDLDFLDRTVLKVATMNEFAPLCASDKVSVLLDEIWHGRKTAAECDGHEANFSALTHLAENRIQRVRGKMCSLKDLATQHYSP